VRTPLARLVISAGLLVSSGYAGAVDNGDERLRSDIVVRALAQIDIPYRYGGSTPAVGFDCSGLVRYVYGTVAGRELPRRSEEMVKLGDSISRSQLEPGDLVFFNTLARAYSHVAIYIGDGRFLHAPARGGKVRIEALDDRYWTSRFNGARRLLAAVPADISFGTWLRGPPSSPQPPLEDVVRP